MFGRNKEVEKALQSIAVVTFLYGAKQLAEDDGRRDLKGWEEGWEGALDGRVQRFRVLQHEETKRPSLVFNLWLQKQAHDNIQESYPFFLTKTGSKELKPQKLQDEAVFMRRTQAQGEQNRTKKPVVVWAKTFFWNENYTWTLNRTRDKINTAD